MGYALISNSTNNQSSADCGVTLMDPGDKPIVIEETGDKPSIITADNTSLSEKDKHTDISSTAEDRTSDQDVKDADSAPPSNSKPIGYALTNGSWECACGLVHARYDSSCVCGINKSGITLVKKPQVNLSAHGPSKRQAPQLSEEQKKKTEESWKKSEAAYRKWKKSLEKSANPMISKCIIKSPHCECSEDFFN